jgi:hypothetical protein
MNNRKNERDSEKIVSTIKELLSSTNKDKALRNLPSDLYESMLEIKEMIDSNEITQDDLGKAIMDNLENNKNPLPGSVGQLLVGCLKGGCPLKYEEINDIPYIYNAKDDTFMRMSNIDTNISPGSYAIIYMTTGMPSDIKRSVFSSLMEKGFTRAKILYKKNLTDSYKTKIINNIKSYHKGGETPKYKNMATYFMILTILTILMYSYLKRKK